MNNGRPEQREKVIELAARAAQKKSRKYRWPRRIVITLLVIGLLGALILNMLTYSDYEQLSEQSHTDGISGAYTPFGSGFVRYTSNGIQYINYRQETVWETSFEMKNPTAEDCQDRTLALADLEGNQIYVFDRTGILGSITTTMPIQAFAVSEQGVVAVVLRQDEQLKLILYTSSGDVLVEGRVSFSETGYPLAVAIAPNGQKVLISYVLVGDTVSTRLIGYNFENVNASEEERIMFDDSYEGMIIPAVDFLSDKSLYAIGNGRMLFYEGSGSMSLKNDLTVEDPIRSVVSDGDRVGVVTALSDDEEDFSLEIYNESGRKLKYMKFSDDYSSIYMQDKKIFLLQGTYCVVYSVGGHRVFDGEFDTAVSCMVPVWGINRYLVAEEGRLELVRLVKRRAK